MKTTTRTRTETETSNPNTNTKGPTKMNTETKTPEAPAPNALCPVTVNDPFVFTSPLELANAKRDAWERTREARRAITREQLCEPNFDVTNAVIAMRAGHRRSMPFREIMLKMPGFEARCFDELLVYAAAMLYGRELPELRAKAEPPMELNAAAEAFLAKFLRKLVPLADEGLIPAQALEEIRQGTGWRDRAEDLSRVATLVQKCWPQLVGQTTIKLEDIGTAQQLANALTLHLSMFDEPGDSTDEALEGHRAMTLAFNAYEEVRRAMGWVRWHQEDAVRFAPSVHRKPPQSRCSSPRSLRSASGVASSPAGEVWGQRARAMGNSQPKRALQNSFAVTSTASSHALCSS